MDLFTHFLVPYIILYALKSKNKLAGAFGGISLDFDTIFVVWIGILSPQFFIFSHRGITHSFIFGLVTSTLFLYVISRKQVNNFIGNIIKRDISVKFTKTTIGIAYFGVLTHLFLDYLTTLGIPLFFPFSITRYAAEIFQALDLVTIVLAAVVLLIVYMKLNSRYKKAAMAIFMIILISFGGIRAYEKINVIEDVTPTLNGNYSQLSVYPTSDFFKWNVVKRNVQNTSFIVSEYNTQSNQESNIKTYATPTVENGNYSSAMNAINIANTYPVVKQFKWNSYFTVVDAKFTGSKWDIRYSDILKSYTVNNITVSVNQN
jgi:inner membrane protein